MPIVRFDLDADGAAERGIGRDPQLRVSAFRSLPQAERDPSHAVWSDVTTSSESGSPALRGADGRIRQLGRMRPTQRHDAALFVDEALPLDMQRRLGRAISTRHASQAPQPCGGECCVQPTGVCGERA